MDKLPRRADGQCLLTLIRNTFLDACVDEVFDTLNILGLDDQLHLTLTGDLVAWQFTFHPDGNVVSETPQGLCLDPESPTKQESDLADVVIGAVARVADLVFELQPLLEMGKPVLTDLSLEEGEILDDD